MMHSAMQKLRALAVEAQSKIWQNRNKKVPGKWTGFDDQGTRTWKDSPVEFLIAKLREEVEELAWEVEALSGSFSLPLIRREAGDVAAMAMMIVDRLGGWEGSSRRPKVVCLCGSTRFKNAFMKAQFEETMKGYIVLTVGAFMHADKVLYREGEKIMLDDLHKRKIDLADEILVINVGGYIGESTRGEILHANETGKDVRYLEPLKSVGYTVPDWPFPTTGS